MNDDWLRLIICVLAVIVALGYHFLCAWADWRADEQRYQAHEKENRGPRDDRPNSQPNRDPAHGAQQLGPTALLSRRSEHRWPPYRR